MSSNTQQAQAVTNTLAGEKLVQTVSFPLTGDSEMDFIGGLLAVWEGLPLPPAQALRAAEYFHARVAAAAKRLEESVKEAARKQSEEAWLEKKRQELLHRIQSQQGSAGQIISKISKWTAPNQTPGPGHPPPLTGDQAYGIVPLPHPPEFAEQVRQRGLNAQAESAKLESQIQRLYELAQIGEKLAAQPPGKTLCEVFAKEHAKQQEPPKELPPCDPGF